MLRLSQGKCHKTDLSIFGSNPHTHEVNTGVDRIFLVETQPMRALYLESISNKKQERLCEVVSQWLTCQILSNLHMIDTGS